MAKRHTNRLAWGLAILLGALVLGGVGVLGVWFRWYSVAKHHGRGAKLQNAWLIYAPLRGADLKGANLQRADLGGANLSRANLWGANLQHSRLAGANLAGAALTIANLQHADLREADLRGADLRGANLHRANLIDAKFAGAYYDQYTRWPAGFDPKQHGAVMHRTRSGIFDTFMD